MKTLAVIPARYGSTRFPGKPLAPILGKPMIEWVIRGATTSKKIDDLIVATDDERIFDVVYKLGFKVEMTPSDLPTGTDRIYVASQKYDADIILNIQGDEPLISAKYIDPLVESFLDPQIEMATLSHPFAHEDELINRNAVKVIKNKWQNAIYFSRFEIPYSRADIVKAYQKGLLICEKHIGLYGYRKEFLKRFCEEAPSELEQVESLEQLRALYMGALIRVHSVDRPTQGVDTPEDVFKVEKLLQN